MSNMSKMTLLSSYGMGLPVSLFDARTNLYQRGYVQSIGLESGYTPPAAPSHFLVKLRTAGGDVSDIYVRTDD